MKRDSKDLLINSPGYAAVNEWFQAKDWHPYPFQIQVWDAISQGKNGMLNAPTGSGKTYSLFMPFVIDWINKNPNDYTSKTKNGLRLIWVTPIRALTNDIQKALQKAAWEMKLPWLIKVRTGDTSTAEKQKMKRQMPEVLITTPESLHIMLGQKEHHKYFEDLDGVVVDEWHELLGNKRGVLMELALNRMRTFKPTFITWCISATIGNMDEALKVMLGVGNYLQNSTIVHAEIEKKLKIESILPDDVERFPWAGHLGLKLLPKIIPIIDSAQTTLVFVNTRAQCELWYRSILEFKPDYAGSIAIHHGSLDKEVREWVEASLHTGQLKICVCTSSLDLGVDFSPVDAIIQIGSPKGVSRFLQRAGRSGHRPGALSTAYFLPTHALELVEAAALKYAITLKKFERRIPVHLPIDVLLQYMMTLAVGDGFLPDELYNQINKTFTFKDLEKVDFDWCCNFLIHGGNTLKEYDEFQKVVLVNGKYVVTNKRIAYRHRMSIGTIVSDPLIKIQFQRGSFIGQVEESFISKLNPGNVFWYSGRSLEFVQLREMTAIVKKSTAKNGIIPSFQGSRMSLSSKLAEQLREKLSMYHQGIVEDVEMETLRPLLDLQERWSLIPDNDVLLIENLKSKEGFHIYIYAFAGRLVHEGFAALIAYRLSQIKAISFSIAYNDYGFELMSDEDSDIQSAIDAGLFRLENLESDLVASVNSTEMAKRRFREISQIAGLIFTGFPGKSKRNKQLQASSSLIFEVFRDYDPENLLIKQAYEEVYRYLLDTDQLKIELTKINLGQIIVKDILKPTPFAFPIMVDRMREKLSSEGIVSRIEKLQLQLELDAELEY